MQLEFNSTYFIFFFLISFFFAYLITRYSNSFFSGSLLDNDFLKPQAFHKEPIARIGGFVVFILFVLFILFYFLIFDIFLKDYFTISLLLFVLGFLNLWLENNTFQLCFVLLCFLFIINGANLIDGFNGLLAIHFLIINSFFLLINLSNQNENISIILFAQIIIVLSFLLFNFPKAKIFLGDSGSYLLGSLIVLNTINTSDLNPQISPLFFTCVLFYLFYEVFFSFIRKTLLKNSPLKPDKNHLHMLLYGWLSNVKKIENSNYLTSLLVNSCYLFSQIPLFYFQNNGLISRYWFFSLITFYTIIYFRLYSLSKK